MNDEPQCSETVYSGERWDFTGHQCSRKGKEEYDGKWYCRQHNPEAVAEKQARKDAEREEFRVADLAARAVLTAEARRLGVHPRFTWAAGADMYRESPTGLSIHLDDLRRLETT